MRYQLPNVETSEDPSNDHATYVQGQEEAALLQKHSAKITML